MYVGVLKIRVEILDALNLKDKRKVVKSVFERVRSRYNFSYGEIEDLEIINLSTWGFSCVSNSHSHVESCLENLINYLDKDYRFEILEIRDEIICY